MHHTHLWTNITNPLKCIVHVISNKNIFKTGQSEHRSHDFHFQSLWKFKKKLNIMKWGKDVTVGQVLPSIPRSFQFDSINPLILPLRDGGKRLRSSVILSYIMNTRPSQDTRDASSKNIGIYILGLTLVKLCNNHESINNRLLVGTDTIGTSI